MHVPSAGWQSTPIVSIFKQCDAENKKNVELSGKVGLRMVRQQGPALVLSTCRNSSILLMLLLSCRMRSSTRRCSGSWGLFQLSISLRCQRTGHWA